MKQILSGMLAILMVCLVVLLLGEGVYAIAKWNRYDGSITWKTVNLLTRHAGGGAAEPDGPHYTRMASRAELEALIPTLQRLDAGLGNTDFTELQGDAAAINRRVDDCLLQKPNLRKTIMHLRTNAFDPLDPVTLFYDADAELPPAIVALVENYGLRPMTITTNADGERITLPEIASPATVIVAGDSVADGMMVDDHETLASQLQRADRMRRYVNTGVGGADAADVLCNLERALERHGAPVEEIIYIYCENDIDPDEPFGAPAQALTRLAELAAAHGIGRVSVVYAPFIYNVVPQYTRFEGYRGARRATHAAERAEIEAISRVQGWHFLDIADLALSQAERFGTQFAVLNMFVDHVHLSPYGTAELAAALSRKE